VNEQILAALPVRARWLSYEEAIRLGAMALFGEKYGDRVRVVEVVGYSRELCGGTHLTNTAHIGFFKIVAEGSAAAGIRRIEAVTGRGAAEYLRAQETALREIANTLRVAQADVVPAVRKLLDRNKQLERDQATVRYYSRDEIQQIAREAPVTPSGIKVIIRQVEGLNAEGLRRLGDQLREAAPSSVVALASESNGKTSFVAMVAPAAAEFGADAAAIAQHSGTVLGGSGGGNAYLGQAGGRDPTRLPRAVEETESFIWESLSDKKDDQDSRS
jgi:alanyl-tRNA synthetase